MGNVGFNSSWQGFAADTEAHSELNAASARGDIMIGIASWISGTCFRGQHRAGSATALGGSRHGWLLGAVVTLMVLGAADQAYAQCSGAGTPTVTCGGTVVNPGQNCQNVSDIRTAGPHVVWQCNEASQRAIYSNT